MSSHLGEGKTFTNEISQARDFAVVAAGSAVGWTILRWVSGLSGFAGGLAGVFGWLCLATAILAAIRILYHGTAVLLYNIRPTWLRHTQVLLFAVVILSPLLLWIHEASSARMFSFFNSHSWMPICGVLVTLMVRVVTEETKALFPMRAAYWIVGFALAVAYALDASFWGDPRMYGVPTEIRNADVRMLNYLIAAGASLAGILWGLRKCGARWDAPNE